MTYLRRQQGEEINASHLPHPDMLTVMSTVSREDFRTMLVNHMNKDDSELAALETIAKQSVQRMFCLQHVRLTDVTVLEVQEDRDLDETEVRTIQVLHLLLRDGKGNFTTGLITETEYSALYAVADDLDVLFVKHDSHWESFVQTQRDILLHRSKRTKRV